MQARMLEGLKAGEFRVMFQPIVQACTRNLSGVECLIRWQHPDHGLLLPGSFLGAFDDVHIARETSYFVLEDVCRQLADLQRAGNTVPPRVSINIQPSQLVDDSLSEHIRTVTEAYGIDPCVFELELVETGDVSEILATHEFTGSLRRRGVRIALDDFGAGYTSLTLLDRMHVDTIKLARQFLPGIPHSPLACTVVGTILDLFERLGIAAIVEGVETAAQMTWLARRSEIHVQGYYIARPQLTLLNALNEACKG